MRIPEGYTQEEILDYIDKIGTRFTKFRTFDIYEPSDIKQEIFLICLEGLERFDPSRGAKVNTFLTMFVNSRIKNLKRDKYYAHNDKFKEEKSRIKSPESISNLKEESISSVHSDDFEIDVQIMDLKEDIDKFLPIKYRETYTRMIYGGYVEPKRRKEVERIIMEYLNGKEDKKNNREKKGAMEC